MKKILIFISILSLLCGCEISVEHEDIDNQIIKECLEKGGKAIVNYCHNDSYICNVTCELQNGSDSNE